MSRKVLLLLIGVPVALVVLAVGGSWVYLNLIKEEAPDRLTLGSAPTTVAGAAPSAADTSSPDGTWTVGEGTTAGYRVKEVLFGQSATAAGRTSAVTGTLTVSGTTVPSATFTVDMTTVKSDSGQRDGQFHGRIMQTSRFPKAVFTLTSPIRLPVPPKLGEELSPAPTATGTLELHGVTKQVSFPVKARWDGATISVNGTVPIRFSDYDIDNPSGGPAQVGDEGEMEFTLQLRRA